MKGQVSQTFTYIMVILIVGLLVVFGYKGISSILKTSCEQQSIQFQKNLFKYIEEYSDKGSVQVERLVVPCDAKEVCFADYSFYEESAGGVNIIGLDNLVMKNNIEEKNDNVFLKTDFTEGLGFSNKIMISDPKYKCFKPKAGRFEITFVGQGRKTEIVE